VKFIGPAFSRFVTVVNRYIPPMLTSAVVKNLARAAGFDLCGVCRAEPIGEAVKRFDWWLEQGFQGEMDYLPRRRDERADPSILLPGAKSVIMLGLNYYQPDRDDPPEPGRGEFVDRRKLPERRFAPKGKGRVSKYARGRDYHKVILRLTKHLARKLEGFDNVTSDDKFYHWVDYGPFLERAYGRLAGLGYIGRNSMLINREYGSYFFLAEILTTVELEPDDRSAVNHGICGKCRRCIEACPTGAILEDGVIDARRCISYLTIERPTEIPEELHRPMGDYLFGCDICQEVCPHNLKAKLTAHGELLPEAGVGELIDLGRIESIENREQFLELTAGTPLVRPRQEGLQRNAGIVRRNQSE